MLSGVYGRYALVSTLSCYVLAMFRKKSYVHQASQDRITDVSSNLCIMRIEAGTATYHLTYQVI